MTDNTTDNNVSELPRGGILIAGHAPTVRVSTAKAKIGLEGSVSINGSNVGPTIPAIQASGTARVVKKTLTDSISVTDGYEAVTDHGRQKNLITPPWLSLRKPIRIITGRKFLENVVEPTIADIHHQHNEAMMRGDDNEARFIQWVGLLRILLVLVWAPIVRQLERLFRPFAG